MVNLSTLNTVVVICSFRFLWIYWTWVNLRSGPLGPHPVKIKISIFLLFCSQFDNFPLLRSVQKLGQIKRKETASIFFTKQTIMKWSWVYFNLPEHSFIALYPPTWAAPQPSTFITHHLTSQAVLKTEMNEPTQERYLSNFVKLWFRLCWMIYRYWCN